MISPISVILSIASVLMALGMAVLLLRAFSRTREKAFLLLGLAAVVWPLVSWLINYAAMRSLYHHQPGKPMNLGVMLLLTRLLQSVPYLERFIDTLLMLIAVYYLSLMATRQISEGEEE